MGQYGSSFQSSVVHGPACEIIVSPLLRTLASEPRASTCQDGPGQSTARPGKSPDSDSTSVHCRVLIKTSWREIGVVSRSLRTGSEGPARDSNCGNSVKCNSPIVPGGSLKMSYEQSKILRVYDFVH